MVAWRRLGLVVGSLMGIACMSVMWNTDTSDRSLVSLSTDIPDEPPMPPLLVSPTEGDGRRGTANESTLATTGPLNTQPCLTRALELIPRGVASQLHCHGADAKCLDWALFPSDPVEACDFLCAQASESRPAIWKQSKIRSDAIVDTPKDKHTTNDSSCEAAPSLVYPPRCLLGRVGGGESAPAPVSLLFIGHSHSRFLASMLCMMLNATSCKQLEDQFKNISVVRQADIPFDIRAAGVPARENLIRIAFVQSNYHFGQKVQLMQTMFSATELASFTHVIFSRGSWDLLFYDRPPREVAEDLRSSLKVLYSVLPPAIRKVIHLHHYVHHKAVVAPKKRGPNHAALRAGWRRTCFSPPRLEQIRDATLCGSHDGEVNERGDVHRVEVYDTYTDTRTPLGFQFVDTLGHHYQDVMLEFLAMKFLRQHVCFPALTLPPRLTSEIGTAACRRTDVSTGAFKLTTECACHHPTERRDHICRNYGRSVPDISRRS